MKKIFTLLFLIFHIIIAVSAQTIWCGNSFIVIDNTWYTGSNAYQQPSGKFQGANLGTFNAAETAGFTLGGELQVYPSSTTPAEIWYKIDNDDSLTGSVQMPKTSDSGNNSVHQASLTNGDGAQIVFTNLNLGDGEHTIAVWFKHDSQYDSNNNANYIASFVISGTTGIEKARSIASLVSVNDGTISAQFDTLTKVELYSVRGELLKSDSATNSFSQLVSKGIYILNIDGKAYKVLVK